MEGMRGTERPPRNAATLSAVGKSNLVMQDCELYGRILGIAAPWRVERVELQLKQGEVHVYLAHENKLVALEPRTSAERNWVAVAMRILMPSSRRAVMSRRW